MGGRGWREANHPIGRHVSHLVNTSLEKQDARLGHTKHPHRPIQLNTQLMYLQHHSVFHFQVLTPSIHAPRPLICLT